MRLGSGTGVIDEGFCYLGESGRLAEWSIWEAKSRTTVCMFDGRFLICLVGCAMFWANEIDALGLGDDDGIVFTIGSRGQWR